IVYIELDKDLAVDKVCDIFTQINSRGIRLDVFDLINALLKPKGLQLKHMWRDASTRLNFVDTEKMNVYILQVMSILSQSYCSPKYLYYLVIVQHLFLELLFFVKKVSLFLQSENYSFKNSGSLPPNKRRSASLALTPFFLQVER
ncbi:DUF262 domain-containing protein, partial [Candidatus Parcubacteria bacterium]|nr:DUF262 domain-containing protein [Candidatus Parcubacteria bacterium]